MLNRTREYIDDAPVSRTAKPIGYYVSGSSAIDTLKNVLGDYLELATPEQKCLMGAVLFDQLGGGCPNYTMRDSLDCIDPDCLLGQSLSDLVIRIVEESDNGMIAALLSAIAAFVADDIRNEKDE